MLYVFQVAFLILLGSKGASASDFSSGLLRYTITSYTAPYTVRVDGLSVNSGYSTLEIPARVSNNGILYKVTSIAERAFQYEEIYDLTLNEGLQEIGDYAFYCCPISTVTLPSTVSKIDETSFGGKWDGCPEGDDWCWEFYPDRYVVNQDNPYFSSADGVLYNKNQTELIAFPKGKGGIFTVPETVVKCSGSLYDSEASGVNILNLTNWCQMDGVGYLCPSYKDIYINGTKVTSNTTVMIPEGVTTIKREAFHNWPAKSYLLPSTLTNIEDNSYTFGPKWIEILNEGDEDNEEEVYHAAPSSFSIASGNTTFSVVNGILYKGDTLYKVPPAYSESVIIARSIACINKNAFDDCDSLRSIYDYAWTPQPGGRNISHNKSIHVPVERLDAYREAWGNLSIIGDLVTQTDSIILKDDSCEVGLYKTYQMLPEYPSQYVNWHTSDSTIVTVDSNGLITSKGKSGSAKVWVEFKDNAKATDTCVVVVPKVENINLDTKNKQLGYNGEFKLSYTIYPALDSLAKVKYSLKGDPGFTVDPTGLVKATYDGTATVYCAYTCDSTIYDSCVVNVYRDTVAVTDASKDPKAIYLDSIKTRQNSRVVASFLINTDEALAGFQADICLPKGVSFEKNSDGSYNCTPGSGATSGIDLQTELQADNSLRVLATSTTTVVPKCTGKVLLTLVLDVDSTISPNNFAIQLKNIALSNVNGDLTKEADQTTLLYVINPYTYITAMGDVDNDGSVRSADAVLVVNKALNREVPVFVTKAADLDSNGEILVNDAVKVMNIIVYGSPSRSAKTYNNAINSEKSAD